MEEDGDALLGQDEIEKLLAASLENKPDSKGDEPAASKDSESAKESQVSADEIPSPRAAGSAASAEGIAPGDLEYLFNQAERALRSLDSPSEDGLPPGVQPFELEPFGGAPPSSEMATIDVIRDVELNVRIELGRTQLQIEDVLKLRRGAVVPLDKLAGDPVDIFVNERLIARGEILVLNDNFCVRVTELVAERAIA
jgi:flagellar motor switch protein FliN/FliY